MKPWVLNGLVLLFCLFVCLFVWFSIIFALVLTEGTSKYVATYLEDKHFQCVSGDKNISSKTAFSLLLTNLELSLEV